MTRTARDKAIRAARQKALNEPRRPGCPTPAKRGYANEEAVHKALRGSVHIGSPIGIYKCVCGTLHLTKRKVWK